MVLKVQPWILQRAVNSLSEVISFLEFRLGTFDTDSSKRLLKVVNSLKNNVYLLSKEIERYKEVK